MVIPAMKNYLPLKPSKIKNLNKIKMMAMLCLFMPTLLMGQVRPDIMDPQFSSQDRTDLANLIMDFVTPEILQMHCDYVAQSNGQQTDIHSDYDFLPFHRMYLEKLEDYLLEQGRPEFVPLPKWSPATPAPIEFQTAGPFGNGIDPDCGSTDCHNGVILDVNGDQDPSYNCADIINWNPNISLPPFLSLPIQSGSNNDICELNFSPVVPGGVDGSGLSSRIENPWHNPVHGAMGGAMGFFTSPSAVIFWIWHAYVDDVWKSWECNCPQSTTNPVDLYMKDNDYVILNIRDRGEEPDIDMGPMWESKDIWVRQQQDGFTNHENENAEYYANPSNFNYVYVQVRNRGCVASAPNESLKVYWSKAGTALSYPSYWNGSQTTSNGDPVGDIIATVSLPSIPPGESYIAEVPWQPVNPALYVNTDNTNDPLFWISDPQPHHFCLLARVESSNDPINYTNGSNLQEYARQNNNVVWKNISVVDFDPNNIGGGGGWIDDKVIGATVMVGDAWGTGGKYDFEFANPEYYKGNPVTAEAEVKITLSPNVWQKWEDGGFQSENIQIVREERYQILVTGNPALLKNLSFQPNERNLVNVGFNFLAKQLSGQKLFDYRFIQRSHSDQKILGGETYHINIPGRPGFYADAGPDKTISQGESADLNAYPIGESAIFNWYSPSGELIYTGQDLTVSPDITKQYKLEVIATLDGVKDYDDVIVKVKEFEITGMSPNPATDMVTINYKAENATSAYLMIMMPYGSSSNHIIDVSQAQTTINVSNYQTGAYSVILVCNGQAADTQTLIVQ